MVFYPNVFAELASRVRCGELQAQQRFREEIESAMVLMARQTLRGGVDTSPIARRIRAVARRLTAQRGCVMFDSEDLVREVAHKVCDEVVSRLRPSLDGPASGESVRAAGHGATLVAC
jgi:hypothetical protein